MKVKNLFLILIVLCLGWTVRTAVCAEETAEPAFRDALYESAPAGGKNGYVDMAYLFNHHPALPRAVSMLQAKMKEVEKGRRELVLELQQMQKDGRGSAAIRAQWEKISAYDSEAEVQMNTRQAELFDPVFQSIEKAVKRFGEKQGYQAIYVEPREDAENVTEKVAAMTGSKAA